MGMQVKSVEGLSQNGGSLSHYYCRLAAGVFLVFSSPLYIQTGIYNSGETFPRNERSPTLHPLPHHSLPYILNPAGSPAICSHVLSNPNLD